MVTIQYRSKHMLLRPYEYDSIVQNPISEADFKWILHRNCEVTEQLRYIDAGDTELRWKINYSVWNLLLPRIWKRKESISC